MKYILTTIITLLSLNSIFAADTLRRPQTPIHPFNYNVEDVFFNNYADSATLAGTLTYPFINNNIQEKKSRKKHKEISKFPAVILVSGSGSQNRDEEILGHKPFAVIADHLTKNGIAVLRFDDRGFAQSSRGKGDITTFSNARDVEAGIDFLKEFDFIDKSKIGIIGHSEGGTIAFILGATRDDLSFIVSLAGASVRGDTLLLSQNRAISKAYGMFDKVIDINLGINRSLYEVVINSSANDSIFIDSLNTTVAKKLPSFNASRKDGLIKQLSLPWMYEFIRLDPSEYISKINIPVLALNGKKDLQVLHHLNLPAIESSLKLAGNSNYSLFALDSLNHLFQHCSTGLVGEYEKIEETFSPQVLDIITAWILEQ